MWSDLILRFFLGGVVVSVFSLLGDMFKPKSFAGLFSAAPSIALGTIGLTLMHQGADYAAVEGRSMVAGAIALFLYSQLLCWLMIRYRFSAVMVSISTIVVWFASALGIWFFVLR